MMASHGLVEWVGVVGSILLQVLLLLLILELLLGRCCTMRSRSHIGLDYDVMMSSDSLIERVMNAWIRLSITFIINLIVSITWSMISSSSFSLNHRSHPTASTSHSLVEWIGVVRAILMQILFVLFKCNFHWSFCGTMTCRSILSINYYIRLTSNSLVERIRIVRSKFLNIVLIVLVEIWMRSVWSCSSLCLNHWSHPTASTSHCLVERIRIV